ncbi:copper resistance protein B [Lysobacter silvisoli]|uniref:Copper resistance protein B n=1 Tax=Lysobacter silvisoli TaxID=2293254 RepID=A0A371K3K0_9GAMM|nr:copper resistance protein B [Lysobacter silvisoli]RDZ28501.1 copper resistance protein B [Lysobacter silvisoli]
MSALRTPQRAALAAALMLVFAGAAQAQHHAGHTPPDPSKTAETQQAQDAHDHSKMGHAAPVKDEAQPEAMDHSKTDHSKMDHGPAPAKDEGHSGMDHSKMGHAPAAAKDDPHAGMDHSQMDHSKMGHGPDAPQQPREPIPPITDADRAAAFPPISQHMEHAREFTSYVLLDRLETGDADHGRSQAWEAGAWFGSDLNRLWLRSEGEREDGRTESADLEVLYGRSVSPWWDVVVGAKHDFQPGGSQDWIAVGVQGLSPYKFEVQATAYIGASGRVAANIEAEYDVLLTNRLILQPVVEAEFNSRDDIARGVGQGFSKLEAGLRLRYEFHRRFAPYVGVVHERSFGATADLRRDEGEAVSDNRVVAGVRVWF